MLYDYYLDFIKEEDVKPEKTITELTLEFRAKPPLTTNCTTTMYLQSMLDAQEALLKI